MMNTSSLKGAGKLSRKLLTTLMVAAMPTLGMAADNSIYVDQSGSGATVAITQDGFGNVVRGVQPIQGGDDNTVAAKIYGDNASVTINQVGNQNKLDFSMQGSTMGGYQAPTVNYSVTGNSATAIIDLNSDGQNSFTSSSVNVTQVGNSAGVNIKMTGGRDHVSINTAGGDSNQVNVKLDGGDSNAAVELIGGGNNTASLIMSGSNSVGIKSDGASNTYTVNQNGINSLSIGGYVAGDSMVGNGNTVTVGQTGNNTMALGMTGNTNTVSVTQNNTTSDSNILNLRINGNSNTTTINQSNHN